MPGFLVAQIAPVDPLSAVLAAKAGYALCGGLGAVLAISIAAPTARVAAGRVAVGVGVCFLLAEPVRTYYNLPADPHSQIGLNGVIGFASWYLLIGVTHAIKYVTDGETVRDLVRRKLGLPDPPPKPPA